MSKSASLFTLLAVSGLSLLPVNSRAASTTWTGGSLVDSNWQTAANWTTPAAGTNTLVFAGTNRLSNNNNFSAGGSFAGFTFLAGSGSFVLGGNSVTVTSLIDNQSTALQTINLNLIFAGNRNISATSGDILLNCAISGAGGINLLGPGNLTLTGTNTYTSTTVVNSGKLTLDFSAAGAPISNIINNTATSSSLTIRSGETDIIGAASTANTQNFNGFVVGGNSSNKGGGILAVKSGAGGGTVQVNLGAISLNNGGSMDLQADSGATITTTTGTNLGGIYQTRLIWNEADWVVPVAGTGTMTLGALTSYTTLITTGSNAANSILNASGSLTGSVTTNSLKIAATGVGDSLNIGNTRTLTATASGLLFNNGNDFALNNGTIRGGSGTEFNVWTYGPGVLTINSVVGSNGINGLTKAGTGTLVLTGSNTYAGITYVNQGVLSISNNANLGTSGTAILVIASGTLRATSTFSLDSGGPGRTVQLHSGGGTFDVTAGHVFTISGTVTNGSSSSVGTFTKIGAGTLVLSGSNNYTGATIVSAGTLLVNGSLDAGTATTVNNGGTLGGTGTLNGSVTVASGGVLAPGHTTGVLNTGNFSLQSGGTLAMTLNGLNPGTDYNQLNVTGGVTLAGILSLTLGFTASANSLYFLVLNDGSDAINGTFNGLAQGALFTVGGQSFQISYTGDASGSTFTGGNDLALLAVPEPATLSLALAGLGALLFFRRRAASRR